MFDEHWENELPTRSTYGDDPYQAAKSEAANQGLVRLETDFDEEAVLYRLAGDNVLEISSEEILGARLVVGEQPERNFGLDSYLSSFGLENVDKRRTALTGRGARRHVREITEEYGTPGIFNSYGDVLDRNIFDDEFPEDLDFGDLS